MVAVIEDVEASTSRHSYFVRRSRVVYRREASDSGEFLT